MRPEILLAQFDAVPFCSLGAEPEPSWKRLGLAVFVMLCTAGKESANPSVFGVWTDGKGKMKAWLFSRHCQRS